MKNNPQENSIYKQYTYARNVIQANLDVFNTKNKSGRKTKKAGEDYLIYRDEDTEGYNITPNFFIRAHIADDLNYDNDDLQKKGQMERNFHFENRLFDRDTLLLQHYNINFLYVLAVYGSEDSLVQEAFKLKARTLFRDKIIEDIKDNYDFYSLQLKGYAPDVESDEDDEEPETDSRFNRIIREKYFQSILGKAFRPYTEHEFLYLSLDQKEEFFDENRKLLSDLSQDFNIRTYQLGTDPRASINKYITLVEKTKMGIGAEPPSVHRFSDFKDEVFLVGCYRENKNQKEWIETNRAYNVRANVLRNGYVSTAVNPESVSARFLILYKFSKDLTTSEYEVYRIESFKVRSEKWMRGKGYPDPNGNYLVYSITEKMEFESAVLKNLLEYGRLRETEKLRESKVFVTEDWDDDWKGSPIYLTGQEVDTHKNTHY